jgi:hypothetical protein
MGFGSPLLRRREAHPHPASNSVGSQNVIDGSLTNADLAAGILAGITGPVGPKGDRGRSARGGPKAPRPPTWREPTQWRRHQHPHGLRAQRALQAVDASVSDAQAGQAVLFSVQAALRDGVMISGQRTPSGWPRHLRRYRLP